MPRGPITPKSTCPNRIQAVNPAAGAGSRKTTDHRHKISDQLTCGQEQEQLSQ